MFPRTGTKPDINQKVSCHVEMVALLERGEGKEQGKVVKVEYHCGCRTLGYVWYQQVERFSADGAIPGILSKRKSAQQA